MMRYGIGMGGFPLLVQFSRGAVGYTFSTPMCTSLQRFSCYLEGGSDWDMRTDIAVGQRIM